ncbi:MAG: DUF4336 domain-containing protein, partial [Cyanobacteria bacterium P01_D01_bin.2]
MLQSLIFNRGTNSVLAWAEAVAQLGFERVIPCHLDAPIRADGGAFCKAFAFLAEGSPGRGGGLPEA